MRRSRRTGVIGVCRKLRRGVRVDQLGGKGATGTGKLKLCGAVGGAEPMSWDYRSTSTFNGGRIRPIAMSSR